MLAPTVQSLPTYIRGALFLGALPSASQILDKTTYHLRILNSHISPSRIRLLITILNSFLRVLTFLWILITLFVVGVQLLSRVQLSATLWTTACQAPLSSTVSWNLFRLMSIESVMPSNHHILCHLIILLVSCNSLSFWHSPSF